MKVVRELVLAVVWLAGRPAVRALLWFDLGMVVGLGATVSSSAGVELDRAAFAGLVQWHVAGLFVSGLCFRFWPWFVADRQEVSS